MADGALLLTWKNHHAAFCDILSRLREKETFTDVTLVCEGKFYPVHKLVLSACSEHLEKILENTKCRHPVIVLHGIKCSELESLLMFMYAGEVSVPQTSLSQLMHAAELLEVKGLAVPDVSPAVDSKKSKESKHSTSDSPPSKRRKHEDKSSEAERESQAWSSPPPSASSTRCKERKGNLKHSLGRDNRQLEMQEEEEQLATENQASDRTCVREAEAVDLEPIIKEEVEEIYYSDGLAMPEACLNDMNQSFEKDEGSILGSTEGSNQLGMSSDLQHQPSVHPKLCLPHQMPPTPVVMCNSSDSKEWAVESEVLDEIGTGNNNSLAGDDESLSMMADHPTSPQKQQMSVSQASQQWDIATVHPSFPSVCPAPSPTSHYRDADDPHLSTPSALRSKVSWHTSLPPGVSTCASTPATVSRSKLVMSAVDYLGITGVRKKYTDPPCRLDKTKAHLLVKMEKRLRCRVCFMNGRRKDTQWKCKVCTIPLCVNCHIVYHSCVQYWNGTQP